MENNKTCWLPLGSIVLIKGGLQKLMIIARALNVKNGGKEYFFDYGAVPYPQGLVNDQMAYFNHDGIAQVIHEGYRCPEDDNMVRIIRDYLDTHPNILRGDAQNWNNCV